MLKKLLRKIQKKIFGRLRNVRKDCQCRETRLIILNTKSSGTSFCITFDDKNSSTSIKMNHVINNVDSNRNNDGQNVSCSSISNPQQLTYLADVNLSTCTLARENLPKPDVEDIENRLVGGNDFLKKNIRYVDDNIASGSNRTPITIPNQNNQVKQKQVNKSRNQAALLGLQKKSSSTFKPTHPGCGTYALRKHVVHRTKSMISNCTLPKKSNSSKVDSFKLKTIRKEGNLSGQVSEDVDHVNLNVNNFTHFQLPQKRKFVTCTTAHDKTLNLAGGKTYRIVSGINRNIKRPIIPCNIPNIHKIPEEKTINNLTFTICKGRRVLQRPNLFEVFSPGAHNNDSFNAPTTSSRANTERKPTTPSPIRRQSKPIDSRPNQAHSTWCITGNGVAPEAKPRAISSPSRIPIAQNRVKKSKSSYVSETGARNIAMPKTKFTGNISNRSASSNGFSQAPFRQILPPISKSLALAAHSTGQSKVTDRIAKRPNWK